MSHVAHDGIIVAGTAHPLVRAIVAVAKERGMNVRALARAAGVGDTVIYRWRHGGNPRLSHLENVARHLGFEIGLVRSQEPPPPWKSTKK